MSLTDARTPAPLPPVGAARVATVTSVPVASVSVDRRGANAALWRGLDHAHMMQVELIVAMLTWGGIGYLVDRQLGWGPWLTVLGSFVGYAAGLYLVWLRSQRMDADERAAAGPATEPGGGPRGA